MSNMHVSVLQCVQANDRLGLSNCCPILTAACDQANQPWFEHYGFTNETTDCEGLDWSDVQDQIFTKKKPFIWYWCARTGGPDHMVVVLGYVTTNQDGKVQQFLEAYNSEMPPSQATLPISPLDPTTGDYRFVEYAHYRDGDSDWSHGPDLYNIGPTNESLGAKVSLPRKEKKKRGKPSISYVSAHTAASMPRITEAAFRALPMFLRLATPSNVKLLGFNSIGEIRSASLESTNQIVVYSVDRTLLSNYRGETPVTNLLRDAGEALCPVVVNGEVRSSITVRKVGEGWRATDFGASRLVRLLTTTRAQSSKHAPDGPRTVYFAIELPPVTWNIYVLGHMEGTNLVITPIATGQISNLKLSPKKDIRAEDLFLKMAPVVLKGMKKGSDDCCEQ